MALKKSRPITIRNLKLRWKFKRHKDGLTQLGQSPRFAHVAVQVAEGRGKPLIAYLESSLKIPEDGDLQCGATHKAVFTPGDVAKLVELALEAGWDPNGVRQYNVPAGLELTDYKTIEQEAK